MISPIERQFREAAQAAWWPELQLTPEHPVRAADRNYRIDFAVPAWHFGIELDGHATHSSPTAIAEDRRRQRALERAGWTICRFGGQEITRDAANCVREAKAVLVGLVAHRTSAADREWFTAHPHASEYFRELVPGEFPQLFAPGTRVQVMVTGWGRVRHPLGPVIGGGEPARAALKIAAAPSGLLDARDQDVQAERTQRQFGGPERWSS